MAKITAPFLSFGASGTIAKTLVASKWRGRPYMRQHVTPSNPQTTGQNLTRDIFRNLNSVWKVAGALLVAPWERFAAGQSLTGRNAFVGQNVAALRGDTDLANFIFSPGAKGGLPQSATVFTPGVDQVTVDVTAPTPPTGWSVTRAVACAIQDAAPEAMTVYTSTELDDAAAPYQIILTGLTFAGNYAVGAWLEWLKADGTVAYGPSTTSLETPT